MIKSQMKLVVIDTNVIVVANGKSEQASAECVFICDKRLEKIKLGQKKLVLDSQWQIIGEYKQKLNSTGQPGVGDAFLKWVLTNFGNNQLCDLVYISPKGLDEFPEVPELSGFDLSDRKFVAVSIIHPSHPPILQAVDSLWWGFKDALERNGVKVEFICKSDIRILYDQRLGR